MPVGHAIWKVGVPPTPLAICKLPSEALLEDMIVKDPTILSSEWMLIGRQETTPFQGRIDLLAIAPDGSLILIELKRHRTPRELVAQALDYASWVERLDADSIAQIYGRFNQGGSIDSAFRSRFGIELDEEMIDGSHQIILVAAELDESTERIIGYLNSRDIAINVVMFQVFQHGTDQLLSRAWLIDPGTTQSIAAAASPRREPQEPWNGEFYVSFGGDCTWEDARKHGFISAGGGRWYTRTLQLLAPGDRIWVKMPGRGYVGVGQVLETVRGIDEFKVDVNGEMRLARDVLSTSAALQVNAQDPELAEKFVRVKWTSTVPEAQAFTELGMFGNQNTVCKPTTQRWSHTIERLKQRFAVPV